MMVKSFIGGGRLGIGFNWNFCYVDEYFVMCLLVKVMVYFVIIVFLVEVWVVIKIFLLFFK